MKTLGTKLSSGARIGSALRHLVRSAGAMGVAVLLLSAVASNSGSAGSVGGERDLEELQLVRRYRATTTTVAPAPTTTVAPAPTTTVAPAPATTVAPTTSTTVPPATPVSFAGFETGDFSELQMNQANNGSMAISTAPAASGTRSARATVFGGVNAQYARVGYVGPWNPGARVVYKGSFFFPGGFFSGLTNQMDLMRFDNWDDRPTASEQTGLTINPSGTGTKLYLFRNQLGTGGAGITYIAGPFALPTENAWHSLEVRQTLSPFGGWASNALYVDGVLQGSSTNANMFGNPGNRYNWFRAGIVASGGTQTNPISLFIDNLSMTKP